MFLLANIKNMSLEKDFSFTFIYKCAKHLDVDPTDLIRGVSLPFLLTVLQEKVMDFQSHDAKALNMLISPMFKKKVAEPFYVKMPYSKDEQDVQSNCLRTRDKSLISSLAVV